jgi:prolyl-tRNA editing enzyme YbaK/EbsC (Cys-tRNA(Pro) deacylase)
VAQQVGPVGRADAAFVKQQTGFSIGGVAPVAHSNPPVVLVDQDLFRFPQIWAAAGHPNGVFAWTLSAACAKGACAHSTKLPAGARCRKAASAPSGR